VARICMVLNNFETPFGGPELQAQQIAAALKTRGHQVFIISRGSGKAPVREVMDDLSVIRLNKQGLASVELFWNLYKCKNDFDIIHVHGVGRLASVAIRFAKQFRKQVFIKVTTAGHLMKKPKSKLKKLMQKVLPFREQKVKLLQQADGMIAISNEIRKELEDNGFSPTNIYDIPNGVNTSLYYPVDLEAKTNLRNKLGLPGDKRIFVFSGKLTRRKGLDTLLTAWGKTVQAKKTGMLVLLGSGHGQDDSMEAYLQNSIKEFDLEESVLALGDVANVADYLQTADVFIFPSRREGLPNSLLEAMACGLICIVSDIGGNRDLISSGQTGLLIPVENIELWSKQIDDVVINYDESLLEAAVNVIRDNYDLKVTVDKLEMLFNKIGKR